MGIPDNLTCLLRNLYAGQEATVRMGHGTTDWFKIGEVYIKAVYCQLAYLAYIQSTSWEMPEKKKKERKKERNAGPEEAQAGFKIARRNIHNLRYADDTTLTANEEELKSL